MLKDKIKKNIYNLKKDKKNTRFEATQVKM